MSKRKMFSKKIIGRDPALPIRITICVMLFATLLMFFLPFVTLSVTQENLLLQLFPDIIPAPRSLTAFELIFAFTTGETINPHVNIGPLPCNFYIVAAFIFALAAIVLLLIPKLYSLRYLLSSVSSFISCASIILFRIRFRGYYTLYTKNGGEILGTWFEESKLLVTGKAPYIICAVLLLISAMAAILLYSQVKYDPYFTDLRDSDN